MSCRTCASRIAERHTAPVVSAGLTCRDTCGFGVGVEDVVAAKSDYARIRKKWLLESGIARHLLEKHLKRFYYDDSTLAILQSA